MNNPNAKPEVEKVLKQIQQKFSAPDVREPRDLVAITVGQEYEIDVFRASADIAEMEDADGKVTKYGFIMVGDLSMSALSPRRACLEHAKQDGFDLTNIIKFGKGQGGYMKLCADSHIGEDGKGKVVCVYTCEHKFRDTDATPAVLPLFKWAGEE